MLSMSSKVQKYVLFIFNFVFVLTGISLITVGLISKSADQYEPVIDGDYATTANLAVFIGCFIFVVAFFGCCGAVREHNCMLFTFSVIMAAIFVAELTIGIFAYRLRGETKQLVAVGLNTTMAEYKNTTEIADFWDSMQKDMQCCGTTGARDWSQYFKNGTLPLSCCAFPNDATGTLNCNVDSKTLHNKPCLDALTDVLQSYASTIGLAGIIIAVVQLLGVIFACNLAHSIRNNYESV